jgi:hypothetical protein
MFDTVPSYLRTNISPFIILGVFLAAAVFSYLLYRRTIPPLTNKWRITLSVIRGLAVALILLLLFTPQLTLVWQQRVSDKVALVIDRSASMGLLEKGTSRLNRGERIAGDLLRAIHTPAEVSLYAFNTDTVSLKRPEIDSAQFATDIDAALTHIVDKEKNLTALILLSDGNFTSGRNPLYSDALLRCRIYTVGLGDTVEVPDLLIADVQANKIVYQNKITPVQINLMTHGFTGKETLLQIKADGKVLAAQQVKISAAGSIIPVILSIKPEQLGLRQFEISVDKIPGEVLLANNRHLLVLEVLKSKIRATILASQPDFDVKFLHLLLAANPDLQVEQAVLDQGIKSPAEGLLNRVLDSLDVLILHDFPALSTSRENLSIMEKLLTGQKVPSLLLFGINSSTVNWDFFKRFYSLPAPKFINPVLKTQVLLTDFGKTLPLLNVFSTDQENLNFWQKCPPIDYPFEKMEAGNLLRAALETAVPAGKENVRAPVLLIEQNTGGRNAYLLGSGFWRWHFMLAEDRVFRDGWQTIMKNLLRWLSTSGSSSNVILNTDKRSYQVGETVRISAEVYDGDYKPVDDGLVQFKVTGPAGVFELDGGLIAAGTYASDFQLLREGDYNIEAQALRNDIPLGRTSTRIVCTPVNIEFQYTRQDDQLLRKLADKSGGRYVDESNYSDLFNEFNFPVRYQEVTRTFEIWQKAALLLLIIFLLSVEWFIRKRLGLV